MQNRNVLNSPRLKEFKRRKHRIFLRKIFVYCIVFFIIFFSLSYFLSLDRFNISEIVITGNKVIETNLIKETVKNEIAGYYLYFLPKTNFIIYPKNKIEKKLKTDFKRIRDVFIDDKNINTLKISITERTALYTWCGEILSLEAKLPNTEKCYFVDEDGYVFDEAPYFSGEVYFKLYGKKDENSYFFKESFKNLTSLRDALISIKLKPALLYIKDTGDVEFFLSSGTSSIVKPKIMLRSDADFQNITENLEAALTTEPLKSEFKNKYSSLEYIDLRFGNKVYYKFK